MTTNISTDPPQESAEINLELLDFAEQSGLENMRFRLQVSEALAKDATATLTLLLAGLGAAMAYAIARIDQGALTPLVAGAIALAVWLMIAAVLLVWRCIMTRDLYPPTNEPTALYQPSFTADSIRESQLRNLQWSIEQTRERNRSVAWWLDRVRLMVALSPVIVAITSAVAWACL